MSADSFLIPSVLCAVTLFALFRHVDVFAVFVEGAKEGLSSSVSVVAPLVALMTCVGMLKASGALDFFTYALSPAAKLLGLPQEVLPLALIRPVSGSGALALYKSILESFGPDSYIGRVASVIQGSTETTIYTIAVYCGAVKVAGTRHMLSAGLTADLTGFVMSALTVRMLFN